MRSVIDGNNVIGSRPDGWWRDRAGATRRLVEQLAAWAPAGSEVTVVFDGPRPSEFDAPAAVEVIFAGRAVADDVIAALVADAPPGERFDVVTSDAGLAARVRADGANVVGARSFRDRLER
jgi:predicted RNA-binding protein with PIN domain